GLENLHDFVQQGGVFVTVNNTADFAIQYGFASGVSANEAARLHVVGSLLRSRIVDGASPIVYGVQDSLALYSEDGQTFGISSLRAGGRGFRGNAGAPTRATGRGTADDPDVTPGMAPLDDRFLAPKTPKPEPWQAAPVSDDMLRNPVNVIPPDQRPRPVLRYADQKDLLVSGLLDGNDVAQRPVVVDVPLEKGHVVLFANNPMYRGETIGSYFLVFNTILNWDNLNAGRKLDAR
ncbi:MAG TPA: hypothetical protein VJ867_14235, partial [Gemmatimonadaceae bacterium]|nr:hypothetical protein [Gemmatimonadaceae bacterium]